ncbi:MAG: hypothetical protein IJP17_07340, partial [Clostridia bacterium]|nr:hypothetical protein [Clostridia bacterium]
MKKLAKAWKNVDIKAFLKNNLGEIIVFAVSILILCLYLVLRVGALSISEIIGNDDGRLYISVADNF